MSEEWKYDSGTYSNSDGTTCGGVKIPQTGEEWKEVLGSLREKFPKDILPSRNELFWHAAHAVNEIFKLQGELQWMKHLACWQPDDGEAVTFNWLHANFDYDTTHGEPRIKTPSMDVEIIIGPTCAHMGIGHLSEFYCIMDRPTKGDLRRLLKALGWQQLKGGAA